MPGPWTRACGLGNQCTGARSTSSGTPATVRETIPHPTKGASPRMSGIYEFAARWEGESIALEFATPKPILPAESIAFLHFAKLPRTFKIESPSFIQFQLHPRAEN